MQSGHHEAAKYRPVKGFERGRDGNLEDKASASSTGNDIVGVGTDGYAKQFPMMRSGICCDDVCGVSVCLPSSESGDTFKPVPCQPQDLTRD